LEYKLANFENSYSQALNKLQASIEQVTLKVSQTTAQEIREDLRSVVANTNNLQGKLQSLQAVVEGTNRKAADIQNQNELKFKDISTLVEKSSSWGFWTIFMIFQIFFAVAVFYWKRTHDEKTRKMF